VRGIAIHEAAALARRRVALGVSLVGLALSRPGAAQLAPAGTDPAGPAAHLPRVPADAIEAVAQLRNCDELIARRDLPAARSCFERLRERHPRTAQAHDADRALRTMTALVPDADELRFFVLEPYSSRTNERLRLTSWEKLDFGVTAFVYGLSTGLTAGLALDPNLGSAPALMVTGALFYTGLAVTYVNVAAPDRGDLPLALAVTSYAPLTTALAALATQSSSPKAVGGAICGSALLAIPIATFAANHTDLDPGDTQMVRDAAFWGLVTSFVATLGVTDRLQTAAGAGLGGLYGGLALGLIAANHSEVSLERVRTSTWGGYGGALLGGLIANAARGQQKAESLAIVGGAVFGIVTTFLATASLDAHPAGAVATSSPRPSLYALEPTVLSLQGRDGRLILQPGLTAVRARF
jgi:hypothetical protein